MATKSSKLIDYINSSIAKYNQDADAIKNAYGTTSSANRNTSSGVNRGQFVSNGNIPNGVSNSNLTNLSSNSAPSSVSSSDSAPSTSSSSSSPATAAQASTPYFNTAPASVTKFNTAPTASAVSQNSGLSEYLNNLMAQYNDTPTWKTRTAEERQAQAAGEYSSYYNMLRLAAKQNQEFSDLLLQQQKQSLGRSYDKQREESAQQYKNAYSQSDRQMLSRGMQRSSYAAQTLSNINLAGAKALQDLWDRQTEDEGNIEQQRTLLARQLAEQLSQYAASEANDVLNRIRALEEQDYERGITNAQYKNQLSTQIYQFLYQNARDEHSDQYQAQRDAITDTRWDAQMNYQAQRDALTDSRWDAQMNYQVQRDAVSDSQWNTQMDYQRERAGVSDSQWQTEMDYQRERANVSDSQWERQFNESVRQFNVTNADKLGTTGKTSGNSSSSSGNSGNNTSNGKTNSNGKNTTGSPSSSVSGLNQAQFLDALNLGVKDSLAAPKTTAKPSTSPLNMRNNLNNVKKK